MEWACNHHLRKEELAGHNFSTLCMGTVSGVSAVTDAYVTGRGVGGASQMVPKVWFYPPEDGPALYRYSNNLDTGSLKE